MGEGASVWTPAPVGSPDVPLRLVRTPPTILLDVIKDPTDVIEQPLHFVGLHAGWARAGAVLVAALVVAGVVRWWRGRLPAS